MSVQIDSSPAVVTYLRSLKAVRERSKQVFDLVVAGNADYWDWHEDKFATVIDACSAILERDFGTNYDKIPPHCRANHFRTTTPTPIDRIAALEAHPSFPTDPVKQAAVLIDLYVVSVLLDAGAGNTWSYTETEGGKEVWRGGRSEGIAIASYHMFVDGVFSATKGDPLRVDAAALKALTPEILAKHFQVTETNPMSGLEGRTSLLSQLGGALEARPDIVKSGRPGDILFYFEPKLQTGTGGKPVLSLEAFWATLFDLLSPIWPSRTTLPTHPDYVLGDVWVAPSLARSLDKRGAARIEGDDLVPFHKLTQWLCYSLIEPIEGVAKWAVDRGAGQTGLPEYRNGGLLVDHGLLTIRSDALPVGAYPNGREGLPVLPPSHPAVVEWRAVTVVALDKIHEGICAKLGITSSQLSLAQVLEASTWKGGREIAAQKRSNGGPPIEIISDGTVF